MNGSTTRRRRSMRTLAATAVAAGLLAPAAPVGASPGEGEPGYDEGRHTYTDTIDGADFRVEMPEEWNGTLVMYSHGYYPPDFPNSGIQLTNSPETETWLLDRGYALAASQFRDGGGGFQVEQGQEDQLALLDWFEQEIDEPTRTLSTGQSMGGAIAALLAENHPDRFDGVMTVCGGFDPQNTFNVGLDVTYAVDTLLLPDTDVDLVRPDPDTAAADTEALREAVLAATETEEGRARLSLIASLNNIPGWYSALEPRPTDPEEVVRQQANWLVNAYVSGFSGPVARLDLEARVGGNPSSNTDVDYRHQFVRSDQTAEVAAAYRAADLDLRADLAALNGAPRIEADPEAEDHMLETNVPTGELGVPMATLHSTGDGGAVSDQERWYAGLVRRESGGDLTRQLFVDRGQHCSTTAADEIVTLQSLLHRMDEGHWPNLSPRRLNADVASFASEYQVVTDLGTWVEDPDNPGGYVPARGEMPPAFTNFRPPRTMRPSH